MSNGKDLRKAQKAIKAGKPVVNPYKQDVLYTDMGQWMYPGQVTKIPSNQITMQGVNYPVQGVDDTGYSQMMYPGMNYTFPGQYVTEYPMAAYGGDPSLPNITGHYQSGGWLDTLQNGGLRAASTTGASAVSTKAPQVPLNNTDNYKTGIQYIQEKWKNRDPSDNWNLLMPDKYGSYVDSGVDPFALMLAAPQGAIKIAKEATNAAKNLKSKAYKINPMAEKLNDANKSYRVAGLDAYKDFENTGVLRSFTPPAPQGASLLERAQNRPTSFPSFQKGYADMRYANPEGSVVFETALPTFKRGEINPVTNLPIRGRHYAHRVINPETGASMTEIPASDIRAFGDQPHWWKGYQQIPNSSVKNAKTVNDKIADIKNKVADSRISTINDINKLKSERPKNFTENPNKFLSGEWKNTNQNFVNQNPLDANNFNGVREAPIDPKYLDNFLLNDKPSEGIPLNKYGGQKKLKRTTSKNIQSSINDLMLRNETLFGPPGRVRYKPKLKYGQGGWLDQFDK